MDVGPRSLAHVTESRGEGESERTIGFLLEKIPGRHAGVEDLDGCRDVLGRLHARGIVHGDVNRFNLVVQDDEEGMEGKGKIMKMVDFESARKCESEEEMRVEMESLVEQLRDESGRGARVVVTRGGLDAPTAASAVYL